MWQAQAAEQAVDADPGNGQHGNLTQGIEAAEVDQDHVDHVRAAPAGDAVLEEVGSDAVVGARQHRIGEQRHHGAAAGGQDEITERPQAAGFSRRTIGHEEQRENQQDDGHHFH